MAGPVQFYSRFLALFVVISLMVGFHFLTWGFHRASPPMVSHMAGAHPERGPSLIRKHGCSACHTLPGSSTATRSVGPGLENVKDQMYVAGTLLNTPQNLMLWIQHPEQIRPNTAMPNLGVGEDEARDIVAYLYGQQTSSASR